ENQLTALVDPILALIEQLLTAPVTTLLQVLPNVAYLISESSDSGKSILQQALDNILAPVKQGLSLVSGLAPDLNLDLSFLEDLGLEELLNKTLADAGLTLEVADLIVGTKTEFEDPQLVKVGLDNQTEHDGQTTSCKGAHYIATAGQEDAVLTQLLDKLGVLAMADDYKELFDILFGLDLSKDVKAIDYGDTDTQPAGPTGKATAPGDILGNPNLAWFTQPQGTKTVSAAKYLTDNADAVLNYLWSSLIGDSTTGVQDALAGILYNVYMDQKPMIANLLDEAANFNADLRAYLDTLDLLNLTDTQIANIIDTLVGDTIYDTVMNIFGRDLYSGEVFTVLMTVVGGLLNSLNLPIDITTLNAIDLGDILKDVAILQGAKVNALALLDSVLKIDGRGIGAGVQTLLDNFMNPTTISSLASGITSRASFFDALYQVIDPIMPIFNVLLAGSSLEILGDGGETINKDNKNGQGTSGSADATGFLNILGFQGYGSGLLPILMGIGGGVEGFNELLTSPTAFENMAKNGDTNGQIQALFDPIMYLIEQLLQSPVATLLQMLPNLAYLISDNENHTGESILQQALNNILAPVEQGLALVSGLVPDLNVDLSFLKNLGLEELINQALANAGLTLEVADLIVGDKTGFEGGLKDVGVKGEGGGADYIKIKGAEDALLTQILDKAGILDYIKENGLDGLIGLLGGDGSIVDMELEPINYRVAPNPTQETQRSWFNKQRVGQYLVENADAVINWAWAELFAGNQEGRDYVGNLLGGLQIEDTLEGTVAHIWDSALFQENFEKIIATVQELLTNLGLTSAGKLTLTVAGATFTLDLVDILSKIVSIDGTRLDLTNPIKWIMEYDPSTQTIDSADSLKAALVDFLSPLMPILNVFLAGSDLELIMGGDINALNGNGKYPDGLGTEDEGAFLRLSGYSGYKYGLLPILMALGADVPGYFDILTTPEEYGADDATTEDQIAAIIDPILYLLDRLSVYPVETVMELLPNLAYFVSDEVSGESSLMQQAIDHILYPVTVLLGKSDLLPAVLTDLKLGAMLNKLLTSVIAGLPDNFMLNIKGFTLEDLIIGEKTKFGSSPWDWNEVGRGTYGDFIKVDRAGLLIQLLDKAGAFQLMEEQSLTGLVKLINPENPYQSTFIRYEAMKSGSGLKLYPTIWWRRAHAEYIATRADDFMNKLWILLFGKPFGTLKLEGKTEEDNFLTSLLGDALYTQANFDKIVGLVKGYIPALDNMELIPNVTLRELLYKVVTVDGVNVDVLAMLQHLKTWQPLEPVTGKESFINGLLDYLEPAIPLLDYVLAGKDLELITGGDINTSSEEHYTGGDPNIGGTITSVAPGIGTKDNGPLLKAIGYDGYRYGLIPIFEALLKPIGAEKEILSASAYKALNGRDKLNAILHPLFYLVEQVVSKPVDTIISILPNLCYFMSENTQAQDSPLQQSLDRLTYSLNYLLNEVGVGKLLGIELGSSEGGSMVRLSVRELLDGVIAGIGLKFNINLDHLIVGKLVDYVSISGGNAKYVSVKEKGARGDLLTALIRIIIQIYTDPANRDFILNFLLNSIGLKGLTFNAVKSFLIVISKIVLATRWGTDMAINSLFVIFFFANGAVSFIFNRWMFRNRTLYQLYLDLVHIGGFAKKAAEGLNEFFKKYWLSFFTFDGGCHEFGLIYQYSTFFDWLRAMFAKLIFWKK
ncbi:MAG: hypothetical protein LBG83_05200, partial [Oscillospiraceae bacterium]|nr:hypothetical protein [Oscillospiraceae bacterium]